MHLSPLKSILAEFLYFVKFVWFYIQKKVRTFGLRFEFVKNLLTQIFLAKRGRYKRPFLHIGMIILLCIGILVAPFLATSYPLISAAENDFSQTESPSEVSLSFTGQEGIFQTQVSSKPRDTIITYEVEKGDTISTIAKKFAINEDTIRWANNLTSDSLTVGDKLKILPVSGMSHRVVKGDTVYTIAKRYDTGPQNIINFPFNDFADPETFALAEGETLIVPDGVKPRAPVRSPRAPQFIAGATSQGSAGFIWPASGSVTQQPVWYHMAVDIANREAPPVGAAKAGRVKSTGCDRGGYGCHVIITHDDGLETLYAHLSRIDVGGGDSVGQGQRIGQMGSTGRSTGTHLHFEVRRNGAIVNPLPFLR